MSDPFRVPYGRPPPPRLKSSNSLFSQSSTNNLAAAAASSTSDAPPPLPPKSASGSRIRSLDSDDSDDERARHGRRSPSLLSAGGGTGHGPRETSSRASLRSVSGNGFGSVLSRLQELMNAKNQEIQLAGRLGESLLQQQSELEARIRELEEAQSSSQASSGPTGRHREGQYGGVESEEEDAVGEDVKQKLEDLEDSVKKWKEGNDEIYRVVGVTNAAQSMSRTASSDPIEASRVGGPDSDDDKRPSDISHERTPSNSFRPRPPSQISQSAAEADANRPLGTPSSLSASRRARNAQHRANDIEFATEIGQSLLGEVRRLQALLAERDEQIRQQQVEREQLLGEMETVGLSLRTTQENLDKFKEENWNLELSTQELRTSIVEFQSNQQKSEVERARLTKQLSTTRDTLDAQKTEAQQLRADLAALKARHETDMAQMRKNTAGLQRDKSDLQGVVEGLRGEMANKARSIRRIGSTTSELGGLASPGGVGHDGEGDLESDFFGPGGGGIDSLSKKKAGEGIPTYSPAPSIGDETPEGSPAVPVRRGGGETELRQSLAHAQTTIATLKAALQRERAKKKATGAGMEIDDEDDEEVEEDDEEEQPRKRLATPPMSARGRRRGGARGRGTRGVPYSIGRSSLRKASVPPDYESGEEEEDGVRTVSEAGETTDGETEGEGERLGEDLSMIDDQMKDDSSVFGGGTGADTSRFSLEGMDPAFAELLAQGDRSTDEEILASPSYGATGRAANVGLGRPSSVSSFVKDTRPSSGMFRMMPGGQVVAVPEKETKEIATMTDPTEVEEKTVAPVTEEKSASGIGNLVSAAAGAIAGAAGVGAATRSATPPPPPPKVETASVGTQADWTPDPVPIPEPEKVIVEVPVIKHPDPVPTSDAGLQTDEIVVPLPPPGIDVETSTEPVVVKESKSFALQTDEIPVPVLPTKVEIALQTDPIPDPEPRIVEVKVPVEVPAQLPPKPEVAEKSTEAYYPREELASFASGRDGISSGAAGVAGVVAGAAGALAATGARTPKGRDGHPLPVEVPPAMSRSETVFSDARSIDTEMDRGTETDTDAFEDARDVVSDGWQTPQARPSVDLLRPGSRISFDMPEDEVLDDRAISRSLAQTRGTPASLSAVGLPDKGKSKEQVTPAVKVEVIEVGVQTDEVVEPPFGPESFSRRDSTSTFGGRFASDGPAGNRLSTAETLPAGPAYITTVAQRAISPDFFMARPESVNSLMSATTATTAPRSNVPFDKSKPPVITVPPPPAVPPPKQLTPRRTPPVPGQKSPSLATPPVPPLPSPRQRTISSPNLQNGTPKLSVTGAVGGMPTTPTTTPGRPPLASTPSNRSDASSLRPRPSKSSLRPEVRPQYSIGSDMAGSTSTAAAGQPKMGRTRSFTSSAVMAGRSNSDVARNRRAENFTTSGASMRSSISSDRSRRMSIASSRTSDARTEGPMPPLPGQDRGATDPTVIHAITQTMIGEFLFKYTRRMMTKGISEKRHRRFFWVHPYTRTLYWSSSDPGGQHVSQSSAKSVFIEGVRQVLDSNPYPPGLHQHSIVVKTTGREIKITAPTKERHDMWFSAISYLLVRPDSAPDGSSTSMNGVGPMDTPNARRTAQTFATERRPQRLRADTTFSTPPNGRPNMYALGSASESRLTPRARDRLAPPTMSGKRADTAAAEYLQHQAEFGSPSTQRHYGDDYIGDDSLQVIDPNDLSGDAEMARLGDFDDDGFEGLENVRACCDGAHDVGSLSKRHHHHHHHHHRNAGHDHDGAEGSPSLRAKMNPRTSPKKKPISSVFTGLGSPSKQSGGYGQPSPASTSGLRPF